MFADTRVSICMYACLSICACLCVVSIYVYAMCLHTRAPYLNVLRFYVT